MYILDFLGKCTNVVFSEKRCWLSWDLQLEFQFYLVVFFGMCSAPHAFFLQGLNLNTMYDLFSMVSVRPYVIYQ